MADNEWTMIYTDLGAGLECGKCGHKISIKDYAMADISIKTCPFCKQEMDLASIDEDEIQDILEGEFRNDQSY